MSQLKKVAFKTADGLTLRGVYFQADGENRPVVVMTAGLALLKEFAEPFARRFQDAGFSALLFDYRNYGESDGTPRHETSILQQAEDYRDGVSAAMNLPGVDPSKVVVWGVGHGGAASIISVADDPRPKAAIFMSPMVSGRVDSEKFPKGALEQAWRDREAKTRKGDTTPAYIQAWPETLEEAQGAGGPILFHFEGAFSLINSALERSRVAGNTWENRITLRSLLNVASVEPKDWLHKVAQPTLYIGPPSNPFTGTAEYQREAFNRMGPNGEFKVFTPPSEGGFEAFADAAMAEQISYLRRTL